MVRATPEAAARVILGALRGSFDVTAAALELDADRVTIWRWCSRLGIPVPSGRASPGFGPPRKSRARAA